MSRAIVTSRQQYHHVLYMAGLTRHMYGDYVAASDPQGVPLSGREECVSGTNVLHRTKNHASMGNHDMLITPLKMTTSLEM
jgi:hypothetical protein